MWRKTEAGKAATVALVVFSVTWLVLAVAAAMAAEDKFEGKVVGVGEDTLMVMGKGNADSQTFVVTAETKITRNGKSAKLADILTGDKAMVTSMGMGSKQVAKEIMVAAAE